MTDEEKKEQSKFDKLRKQYEIFRHLNLPEESSLEYKRLATTFNRDDTNHTCVNKDENQQIWFDQVEMNDRMPMARTIDELKDISETYILFAQVSLYAVICPLGSVIVCLANALSMRFDRSAHLYYIKRQPLVFQNSLGTWLSILEFQGFVTVLSNCIILYWFNDIFSEEVNKTLGWLPLLGDKKSETTESKLLEFVITLVIIENFVIILKIIIDRFIVDKPFWVLKREQKVQYDIGEMNLKI